VPKALVVLLIRSDLEYSDDLFNYTRGCFVCDEGYEMSQRQVRFNVNELARSTAEAIGAKSCVSVEKYPDGMYSKSMLLTMDNGSQVVAKVPNPNAGTPHFTTVKELHRPHGCQSKHLSYDPFKLKEATILHHRIGLLSF
jgi:hypothetical protein